MTNLPNALETPHIMKSRIHTAIRATPASMSNAGGGRGLSNWPLYALYQSFRTCFKSSLSFKMSNMLSNVKNAFTHLAPHWNKGVPCYNLCSCQAPSLG